MKTAVVIGLVFFAMICLNGCRGKGVGNGEENIAEELQLKNKELQTELSKVQSERDQLKKQVDVLTNLGTKMTAEDVYELQNVRIGKYTGFYDRDKDGKKETLIVYLQPIDVNGDVVKAIGDVEVQVWDLNKADVAMISEWKVEPDELKKNWYCVLTTNYRLSFDAGEMAADVKGDLTMRVIFTDHLSGKVFKEQFLISGL